MAPHRQQGFGVARPTTQRSHMDRHIDRMLFDDATRIMTGNVGELESAASFISQDAVSAIIKDTIISFHARIRNWVSTERTPVLLINRSLGRDDIVRLGVAVSGLGLTVDKSTRRIWIVKSSDVRLVLRRDPTKEDGYEVHTVFPVVADGHGERMDVDPLPYFQSSWAWHGATPSRRAFISLSCDHDGKIDCPLWFDDKTDSVEIPIIEDGENLGSVFLNETDTALWCLTGCDAQRMKAPFERIAMSRSFPSTWSKIRIIRSEISKHRAHKDLENEGHVDVQPFVPDLRLRAIVRDANALIHNAEIEKRKRDRYERAKQERIAKERSKADDEETRRQRGPIHLPYADIDVIDVEPTETAGDHEATREQARQSKHGERIAKGAAERARKEAEKARKRREKAEARARRKAMQQGQDIATMTDGDQDSQVVADRSVVTTDASPEAAGHGRHPFPIPKEWARRQASGFEMVLPPTDFWHIPSYNPDTNEIVVTLVGLDAFATDDGRTWHPELGGILLHANEEDIEATFERFRELNEDALEDQGKTRRRILEERETSDEGYIDKMTGCPIETVHEMDLASDEQQDLIYYPQWCEETPIRQVMVETPFPRNLQHLIDEGRYDLLTVKEMMGIICEGSWTPLAYADLLIGLGARIVPHETDDATDVTPDSEESAETARLEPSDPRRIAQLPSFCVRAVPSTTYLTPSEKISARIAAGIADSMREAQRKEESDDDPSATGSMPSIDLAENPDSAGPAGSLAHGIGPVSATGIGALTGTKSVPDPLAGGAGSQRDRLRSLIAGAGSGVEGSGQSQQDRHVPLVDGKSLRHLPEHEPSKTPRMRKRRRHS